VIAYATLQSGRGRSLKKAVKIGKIIVGFAKGRAYGVTQSVIGGGTYVDNLLGH